MSLASAWAAAERWFVALGQSGTDITSSAHNKLAKEADEFADDPSLEEAADVFIALVGACFHRGWSIDDLQFAVRAKITVNHERTWSQQPDGTYQHIEGITTIHGEPIMGIALHDAVAGEEVNILLSDD